MNPEFKPSYKSPTFWLSVFASVVGAVIASGVLEQHPDHWAVKVVGLIVTVLSAFGYVVPNMALKQAQVKASAITQLGAAAVSPENPTIDGGSR